MSRELQDRADILMKELKEMLVPISFEIQSRKRNEDQFLFQNKIDHSNWSR